MRNSTLLFIGSLAGWGLCMAQTPQLANNHIKLVWTKTTQGFAVKPVQVRQGNGWQTLGTPSGENTLLYAAKKPSDTPDTTFNDITGQLFPGPKYHYQREQWAECTNRVSLNKAGKAIHFFPQTVQTSGKNNVTFRQQTDVPTIVTDWSIDPKFPTDVVVKQQLTAKKPGYFSLAYGHGIPTMPAIYREQAYGFAPGRIYGTDASLLIREGVVSPENPNVEYVLAQSPDTKQLFVMLLNNRAQATTTAVQLRPDVIRSEKGSLKSLSDGSSLDIHKPTVQLPAFGIAVWAYEWQ